MLAIPSVSARAALIMVILFTGKIYGKWQYSY